MTLTSDLVQNHCITSRHAQALYGWNRSQREEGKRIGTMSQVYITQKSAMSLTFEIEILPKRLRGREDFVDEIWVNWTKLGRLCFKQGSYLLFLFHLNIWHRKLEQGPYLPLTKGTLWVKIEQDWIKKKVSKLTYTPRSHIAWQCHT